ncbi:MAG: DUF4231 domain-containing protein [Phenylobacterium sp.]|nr:MAG: DUF4231 domain-containing protein [Phenylobacterium sp.]
MPPGEGNPMDARVQDEPDSGYLRLEQQVAWYDRKSGEAQRWYKRTRLTQVIVTAFIPVLAFLRYPELTAALAAGVLVLETVQHVNQWQQNWITYRSTCEALRHEKYTYMGGVGSYGGASAAQALKILVERVESLISTENAKWVGRLQDEAKAEEETARKAAAAAARTPRARPKSRRGRARPSAR